MQNFLRQFNHVDCLICYQYSNIILLGSFSMLTYDSSSEPPLRAAEIFGGGTSWNNSLEEITWGNSRRNIFWRTLLLKYEATLFVYPSYKVLLKPKRTYEKVIKKLRNAEECGWGYGGQGNFFNGRGDKRLVTAKRGFGWRGVLK